MAINLEELKAMQQVSVEGVESFFGEEASSNMNEVFMVSTYDVLTRLTSEQIDYYNSIERVVEFYNDCAKTFNPKTEMTLTLSHSIEKDEEAKLIVTSITSAGEAVSEYHLTLQNPKDRNRYLVVKNTADG